MKRGPLFRYYGSKWNKAKHYGEPTRPIVVEPFAGGANYSLYWKCPSVVLVEKDPCIAGIWNWLINECEPEHFDLVPDDCVDLADLGPDVPAPLRDLAGMWMTITPEKPRQSMGPTFRKMRDNGYMLWSRKVKQRIIAELPLIRNWQLIHGDYTQAPDSPEHFSVIDPPYQKRGGSNYVHSNTAIDFQSLADWCKSRNAGVVCESMEADWLPFEPLCEARNQQGNAYTEAVYHIGG